MSKHKVAVVRYESPYESVKKAVELSGGLDHLPSGAKVFVKPNIVAWTKAVVFPKFGVITTSRVIEDIVRLLKEHGVDDITIGEGTAMIKPKDTETPAHAFEYLGYNKLKERYGVKTLNVLQAEFEEVDLGAGVVLNYNTDILHSDFVVDVPVMKTHAQTKVSLGIKNLKGMIDVESRKKCHSADPEKDLHYMIARLANKLPPALNLVDGIYTTERGPSFDGKAHRTDVLVASSDIFSADLAASRVLGIEPDTVPHLVHAAKDRNRPLDLSDVEIVGEKIEDVASPHEPEFPYNEDGTLPGPMVKMGIEGIDYYKYDDTMCTYCSGVNWLVLSAIAMAWKGEAFDNVEVLTGKKMKPKGGKNKTVLLGKCMYEANKDDPNIKELIAIKGCPPMPQVIVKALHQAGIMVDKAIFDNFEMAPGYFYRKYKDRPEFEESFFQVS
jgi:uncharacterized protein (DUF362 family)